MAITPLQVKSSIQPLKVGGPLDGFANASKPQGADLSARNLVQPSVDLGIGAAKGAAQTLQNIGNLAVKPLEALTKKITGSAPQTGFSQEELAPKNTTQKVGKTAEQIGEFFIPASTAGKLEKTVDVLSKGMKPVAGALTRIVGKGAVQGAAGGLITAAQTGDLEKGAEAALVSGGLRSGMATIGEGARAIKLPERLYSMIFKNSKNDMLAELKTDGISNLAKTNPAKYEELVKNGIIKTQNGQPVLNETLAEQALNRGLKGSVKNMANEVVSKSLDAENSLQTIVKNSPEIVDVSEKQFVGVLKSIAQEYEDVGFGEIASHADDLAQRLTSSKGKVNAETALELRRFLDRMRVASSFEKPVSKLSLTQANFKTLADSLRGRLNKIPGVGEIMKDYSFYIDALESLAKEAQRTGNAQALGLIDSIFLGGAATAANPTPAITMGIIRKTLNTASVRTRLAQMLEEANLGAKGSAATELTGRASSEVLQQ